MLTEVRVDEGVQRRSQQKAAEKGARHAGLAESVRDWVQHLLDHNDTDVELVRRRARPPPRSALGPSGARRPWSSREAARAWARACRPAPPTGAALAAGPCRAGAAGAPSLCGEACLPGAAAGACSMH